MRTSSPDEASVELMLAEAEALTALDGAVQALATIGLFGSATMVDILTAAALRQQPSPRWGLLAGIVEALTRPVERRPAIDPKREPALDVLASLYLVLLEAEECRRHHGALVSAGAAA